MAKLNLLIALMFLALLSGCASNPSRGTLAGGEPASHAGRPGIGELVVSNALARVGTPYRYGGSGPDSFDCSGLVQYAYSKAGLDVPRTTGAQLQAARRVRVESLRPGDLLFFNIEGKVSHVALYTGDSRFVHAPSSGKSVSIAGLDNPYWRSRLVAAGRLH